MADIRACGLGWVYCDGNCSTCQKTITTATTSTTPPNFVTGTSHYPVSNADRIRAMADEELAEFIGEIYTLDRDAWGDYDPCVVIDQGVKIRDKDDMLDWLKQEVEQDEP